MMERFWMKKYLQFTFIKLIMKLSSEEVTEVEELLLGERLHDGPSLAGVTLGEDWLNDLEQEDLKMLPLLTYDIYRK